MAMDSEKLLFTTNYSKIPLSDNKTEVERTKTRSHFGKRMRSRNINLEGKRWKKNFC